MTGGDQKVKSMARKLMAPTDWYKACVEAIENAVMAERERCAKIAESIEDSIAEAIAERIRKDEPE